MAFPRRQVLGAVHRDTGTFRGSLYLILAKQPILVGVLVEQHDTRVCIHQIAVRVAPAATGHNVLGRGRGANGEQTKHPRRAHRVD